MCDNHSIVSSLTENDISLHYWVKKMVNCESTLVHEKICERRHYPVYSKE